MPEETINITGADIQSTAQKLATFSEGLTASEKAVIDWVLERAATSTTDVADTEIPGVASASDAATSESGTDLGQPHTRGLAQPPAGAFSTSLTRAMGVGGTQLAGAAAVTWQGTIKVIVRGGSAPPR